MRSTWLNRLDLFDQSGSRARHGCGPHNGLVTTDRPARAAAEAHRAAHDSDPETGMVVILMSSNHVHTRRGVGT